MVCTHVHRAWSDAHTCIGHGRACMNTWHELSHTHGWRGHAVLVRTSKGTQSKSATTLHGHVDMCKRERGHLRALTAFCFCLQDTGHSQLVQALPQDLQQQACGSHLDEVRALHAALVHKPEHPLPGARIIRGAWPTRG